MFRIYVKKDNEVSGHVFKSRRSVLGDKVAILPYLPFVYAGLITESEWAKSQKLIKDRFNLDIAETKIDGRRKLARSMRNFSWRAVLEPSISKRIYL